jgi:membrane-associated phospholipid phosphatase
LSIVQRMVRALSPVPRYLLLTALFLSPLERAQCQSSSSTASLPEAPAPATQQPSGPNDAVTVRNTPRNLLKDQEAIWTSPARLNASNAVGPVLLVLATTAAVTTDHQVMSSSKLDNTSLNNQASTASTGLVGGFVAAPVIIFGLGAMHHDEHARETGILGGEAMLDSLAVSEAMKLISQRERSTLDGARGRFFQSGVGTNSSFPSNHSIIAWSSAAVIASEYRGPLTQITAYGLAAGVSMSRVLARQHFPSDVLVGSAIGWMIGRYVVHRHRHEE